MKALAFTLAAAMGLVLAGSDSAQAGGCGFGRYGGFGYGGYGRPLYGQNLYYGNTWNAGYGGTHLHWHDTSHFDYVPPRIIDHGNHYHVQPGGYLWHQTGHWHVH